ncbi:MAG: phosphotransferase [Polyangiaceae bacterium]
MDPDFDDVRDLTGASRIVGSEHVRTLWGGYGSILRLALEGSDHGSVIVKRVRPPSRVDESEARSHARKLRSYEVEAAWYRTFASRCDESCRVPRPIGIRSKGHDRLFVLEDLDAAGFAGRPRTLDARRIEACLAWLASFHVHFLGERPDGLWSSGTYWHLATRPDELRAIADPRLRDAAPVWDRALREARFRTFVHGDAKPDNFCFDRTGSRVAAVDFQYVGGGVGVQDVAYLAACLEPTRRETMDRVVDAYFALLRDGITRHREDVDVDAIEKEWRALFPVAHADFHRFLAGWAPGEWHRDTFARAFVDATLSTLETSR